MDRGEASWREQAIRDAVLAGDGAAWRAWYDEHYARLLTYVTWRCGGLTGLADDILQETWLTAVRRLGAFDPGRGPFFAWLCGIAANAARSALRSRRRSRTRSIDEVPDPPVGGLDPIAIEKAERVAVALAALPGHYETVLRAKYLDRQTVEEIASTRGVSLDAIGSLLSRAREAFRKAYEQSHERFLPRSTRRS